MEGIIDILKETGSLGLLALVIWRAVPVFSSLRDAILENTLYIKNKNGALEKHMDRQDQQMGVILDSLHRRND